METTIEKRILNSASLRAMSEGDEMALVGYAARYGVLSHPLPLGNSGEKFREKVQRGAFKRAIAERQDVLCTFNHSSDAIPLGRTKSGTLTLSEDDKGLAFRCQLDPRQQAHRDLHASIRRGDVADCSFAFIVPQNGDDWDANGRDDDGNQCIVRTLRDVNLKDVSVVCQPAYPLTEVDARNYRPAAVIAMQKRQRHAEARSICAAYPELSFEHVLQCKKLGYSEDVMLSLRFAALTEQLRAGGAFEVQPMRDGGQAADPQQQLRFKPSSASSPAEHARAVDFHRACASRADSLEKCAAHHGCADAHDLASNNFTPENSAAARAASQRMGY